MPTTITSKGQVTIPKPIRDRLGIKPGTKVGFSLDKDGRALIQTASKAAAPDDAAEANMVGRGIDRFGMARCWTVALAITWRAQM